MSLINCPECGKQISDQAKACPNCGRPMQPHLSPESVYPTPTSLPKNVSTPQRQQKKGHGCLIVSLIFLGLFLCGLAFGVSQMVKNPDAYNTDRMAAKYIDVTPEEGAAIDEILTDCGITTVQNIEHDTMLDGTYTDGDTGYRIQYTYDIGNIIMYLTSDKSVYLIRYVDHDLYADGTTVSTIQDYTFTVVEASELQSQCESLVKEVLKSPSTAKFPSLQQWNLAKDKNTVTVQGYVDSQNSFGAELRSTFQFIIDTDTSTVKSFIFDGQELVNSQSSDTTSDDTDASTASSDTEADSSTDINVNTQQDAEENTNQEQNDNEVNDNEVIVYYNDVNPSEVENRFEAADYDFETNYPDTTDDIDGFVDSIE